MHQTQNQYISPHQIAFITQKKKKGQKKYENITIVCPTYVRLMIKNFKQIDFPKLKGFINVKIFISVYVKHLQSQTRKHIKGDLQLFFSRDQAINLVECSTNNEVSCTETSQYIHFYVNKCLEVRIQPLVVFTPYELVDMVFTINFGNARILYNKKTGETIKVKCNIIELQKQQDKFNFSNSCSFSSYILSQKKVVFEYENSKYSKSLMELGRSFYNLEALDYKGHGKTKKQQDTIEMGDNVSFVHFHIPVYRNPIVALGNTFAPLWLIGLITLGVFYQGPGLADRIGSIATLLIAVAQLIPLVRQSLPLDSKLTIIQLFIYLQVIALLLCLISSLQVKDQDDSYSQSYDAYSDPFYIVSLIILLFLILVPTITFIVFKCIEKKTHIFHQPLNKLKPTKCNFKQQSTTNNKASQWLTAAKQISDEKDYRFLLEDEDLQGFKKKCRDIDERLISYKKREQLQQAQYNKMLQSISV